MLQDAGAPTSLVVLHRPLLNFWHRRQVKNQMIAPLTNEQEKHWKCLEVAETSKLCQATHCAYEPA